MRRVRIQVPEIESTYKISQPKECYLKILQLNIDTISSEKHELQMFLESHNIDVLCLHEMKMLHKDKTPKIPGYPIERRDRGETKGKEKGRKED